MRKNIVIIGDSLLSLLVAHQLDRTLATQAHLEVTYASRDEAFIYPPEIASVVGKQNFIAKKTLFREVTLVKATVKQINLTDRRIVTTAGLIDYDALFIDQTPVFTSTELKKIAEQCSRFMQEIKAKINQGRSLRSRVTFAGEATISWQLALSLASDLASQSTALRRSISIQAQTPDWSSLKKFLADNGVDSRKSVGLVPGLTIGSPSHPFANRLVRGALLDDKNNFITDNAMHPENHPEVTVVDSTGQRLSSILRVNQTLANQITDNIERFIEGRRQQPISLPRDSGLLRSGEKSIVWLGNLVSNRFKAGLISHLDAKFFHRLVKTV